MMKVTQIGLPILATSLAIGCAAPSGPGGSTPPTSTPSANVSATPSPGASPQSTGLTLQGMVYDDDLAPMAGVNIAATGASGQGTATTDGSGRYGLTLPAGTYTVTASKETFVERTQSIELGAAATLDFGGQNSLGGNPFFLTGAPEIRRIEVKEAAPGGPLTLTLELSEALTEASRQNFTNRFEVRSGNDKEFLRADVAAEPYLRTTATWDTTGRVFTFTYGEPYLAGVNYIVRLRQRPLDKIDSVTDEQSYETLNIVDAQGAVLGMGRADYAFLRPTLDTLAFRDLGDDDIGYTPAIRRWRLTHTGMHSFTSSADTTAPGLVSAKVDVEKRVGTSLQDVMELHFTEPMRVARDKEDGDYTLLDRNKELVVVNVSTSLDGTSPKPLDDRFIVTDVKFSTVDPKVVYLYYPSGAFKNQRWVEVNLGADMKDPAGNKPDPAKNRASGPVTDPQTVEDD